VPALSVVPASVSVTFEEPAARRRRLRTVRAACVRHAGERAATALTGVLAGPDTGENLPVPAA